MKVFYLASRYTAPTPEEVRANVERARNIAARIMLGNPDWLVLPSAAITVGLEATHSDPKWWYEALLSLQAKCDGTIVVGEDLKTSRGVAKEAITAYKWDRIVFICNEDYSIFDRFERDDLAEAELLLARRGDPLGDAP